MSTAPCPDPNENNQELFEEVDKVFTAAAFLDEDGNEREVEFLNPDVIDQEVTRFRLRLAEAPDGVSPYDEG